MRWFGIKKTVKLGIKSLWLHRLRSTLTTLGIVFGVCSVIAMLAIGEGASEQAQKTIARLGSKNLIIETVEPPQEKIDSGEQNVFRTYGLTYKDAEVIRNSISRMFTASLPSASPQTKSQPPDISSVCAEAGEAMIKQQIRANKTVLADM